MATEVERKYLLRENEVWFGAWAIAGQNNPLRNAIMTEINYRDGPNRVLIEQGYLSLEQGRDLAERLGIALDFEPTEARLRVKGSKHYLTLKGNGTLSRPERDMAIEERFFRENWDQTAGRRVKKVRISIPYEGLTAEIDLYQDRDLILAEIECPNLETARRIEFFGRDVTEEARYKNKNLAK